MNNIEKLLKERKSEIDHIKAPDELEERLTKALSNRTLKKRTNNIVGRIVAACLVFVLIGYNFDTLAFYSKQIVGYNNVMNRTLKDLNDLGKGQVIDKRYTFENGVTVTLDGIMLDESQLITFYTIEAPEGNVDAMMGIPKIDGFIGDYHQSGGMGELNAEGTIMKNMDTFEPPYFFEKTLHFSFRLLIDGKTEEGEITFKIDRDKAMGHTLKKSINRGIQIDESTTITFKSILASPTRTVIKGSVQNILELAKDQLTNERMRPSELELKLMANGEEVKSQSGGMSTDIKGITFHREYDPLPKDLESLKLILTSFTVDHDINEVIELVKDGEQNTNIHGQNIVINKVTEFNRNTLINITTDQNTILTKVELIADEKRVELNRTIEGEEEKLQNGKILYTRTLEFDGTGERYMLDIKRMRYSEDYNKTIEISIE